MFQSTHSRGVRLFQHPKPFSQAQVSIHALTRSATVSINTISANVGFNPRTHEECDELLLSIAVILSVSIHALTRSATSKSKFDYDAMCVSIHALTRSATHDSSNFVPFRLFQSTHSRGVRPHTLVEVGLTCCFNPRTHEECDVTVERTWQQPTGFNPRTHEECDCIYFFFFIFRYLEQGFREFF